MGTTLNGTQINNTYQGLLKTTDNGVLGATEKVVGDGLGNDSTLSLGTASASFTGTLDLAGATVTGLDGAGLVAGSGTDAMESAAALTTNAADAQGANSIAIGDNAIAYANNSIVIGTSVNDADAVRFKAISIGNDLSTAQYTVNIGLSQNAYGADGVCIGESNVFSGDRNVLLGYQNDMQTYNNQVGIGSGVTVNGSEAIAIGYTAAARATNSITIGNNAIIDDAARVDTVVLGANAKAAQYSTAVGAGAFAIGANCVAVGDSNAAGNYAIAIGEGTQANGNGSVAMGYQAGYLGSSQERFVSIGEFNGFSIAARAVSIGYYGTAKAADSVAIGADARVDNSAHTGAVAIGEDSRSAGPGTVALGRNVTAAAWDDSTTVNQFVINNYANLNYADDTAAATGGVPLGGVYHNAGALRIRIA